MIAQLTHDDFLIHLNSTFHIHYGVADPLDVELISVHVLGDTNGISRRKPFSLEFRSSDREHFLVQQIYRMEHPVMGSMELFLVPVGPDALGMRYEIVIT